MEARLWLCTVSSCTGDLPTPFFLSCPYSAKLWKALVGEILEDVTTAWSELVDLISKANNKSTKAFLLRYAFQVILRNT